MLTPLAAWLLFRYGRQRWFAAAAAKVVAYHPSVRSHVVLWGSMVFGVVIAGCFTDLGGRDSSTALMRVSAGVFGGLVLGALWVRWYRPVVWPPP